MVKFAGNNTGFTLLELMIVVIIIAVLVALGIPSFQRSIIRSRITETYPVVQAINKAEQIYYSQYP